jgi:hypothetical protein
MTTTTPMRTGARCAVCGWYRDRDGLGECARHSPQINRHRRTVWPIVGPDQICGDFASSLRMAAVAGPRTSRTS